MTKTDLLTTEEAAAFLRLTTRTLYKLAKAGVIPSARVGGTMYRFSRASLENYVRATGSPKIEKKKG
jgi:excisionase family DNA binding protein